MNEIQTLASIKEIAEYGNIPESRALTMMSAIGRYVPLESKMVNRKVKNRWGEVDALMSVRFMPLEKAIVYCSKNSENNRINKARMRNKKILEKVLLKIKQNKG